MKSKNMKYSELINKSKKIGKLVNKSCFSVLLDVFKSCKSYGTTYKEYFDLEFYLLNNDERKTYLTTKYNEEIINKYNNKEVSNKLSNKSNFYETFNNYLGREYINLNEVSFKEFKDFIKDKERIVAKRLYSENGLVSVILLDKTKLKNEYNVLKIYNNIMKNEQFLVEDYIYQHSELNNLYNGSVNSLNIVTFVSSNKEVNVLNSILRIGKNSDVDSFDLDGIVAFVNDDGVIENAGIDKFENVFRVHPLTKKSISGFKISNYDEVIKYVKSLALVLSDVRYVSWDVAITEEGVQLLGADLNPKIYQIKPSISKTKTGDLVKYKKYIDL